MKEPLLSTHSEPENSPPPQPLPSSEPLGGPLASPALQEQSAPETQPAPALTTPAEPQPITAAQPSPDLVEDPLRSPVLSPSPESPKPGSTQIPLSWILLTAAGAGVLLVGILIGMKISDYHHFRYFEDRFAGLFDVPAAALEQPPVPSSTPAPSQGYPQTQMQPGTAPAPLSSGGSASLSAPPASTGPDFGGEIAALRQERQMVSQRFESLNNPGSGLGTGAGLSQPGRPNFEALSSSAPPQPQLSTAETRIRDAPAIARVREYDADWHFVVIDGGKERNIAEGTQLAVRRGYQILGLIKVDEVLENESVAELFGAWRADSQAPKPKRGDDVITYPLF